MSMAVLRFYKNKYNYPHYSNTITAYGAPMDCTPVGMNLKTGTLRVKGDMTDFMSCNYLSLTRDGQVLYAWIDNVNYRNAEMFDVTYTVDAWRTYKGKINLGVQMITRRPEPTSQRDPLLGAEQDYPVVQSYLNTPPHAGTRVLVVQRRAGNAEQVSKTSVQPSPYQFFLCEYPVNDWQSVTPINSLITALGGNAESQNLVTMYSIPYMNLSGISTTNLIVNMPDNSVSIPGWKMLDTTVSNVHQRLKLEMDIALPSSFNTPTDWNEMLRVDHRVQLVIPEAGILNIPDELLYKTGLKLRQDIDLFSGASNYMLMSDNGEGKREFYGHSVRGSSVSSIPVLSDPLDTYLSQNQSALSTALLGDVANVVGATGVGFMAGGAGGAALGFGGSIATGITSAISRNAAASDAGNRYTNPPAFLGSALAASFNNQFWTVVTAQPVDNASAVHTHYGYQYGKVTQLTLPASGFIQTEGCNVTSTDGSVPRWALAEVNQLFNNGMRIHTT